MHRVDGAGGTVMAMLYAMAFAAHKGMRYGGALASCPSNGLCHHHWSHGVSVDSVIALLLGSSGFSILHANTTYYHEGAVRFSSMLLPQDPHSTRPRQVVRELNELEGIRMPSVDLEAGSKAPAILYSSSYFPLEGLGGSLGLDSFFSPYFLSKLRDAAACRLSRRVSYFASGRPVVAMHVRRGDVVPKGTLRIRYTSNDHYFRLADIIRKQLPDAQIHVFSHTENYYPHSASTFKVFEQHGMVVHLDGDPLDVLAHLANANIFVMAKSAFSATAAMFNTGCVIYEPFWFGKLVHWANAQALDARSLRDCIAGRLYQPDDPARVAKAFSEMLG